MTSWGGGTEGFKQDSNEVRGAAGPPCRLAEQWLWGSEKPRLEEIISNSERQEEIVLKQRVCILEDILVAFLLRMCCHTPVLICITREKLKPLYTSKGYLEIQGVGAGKKSDPIPISCSHVSLLLLYSAAPESNVFPPGSYTLVLSLIKKQHVAGRTHQIFK